MLSLFVIHEYENVCPLLIHKNKMPNLVLKPMNSRRNLPVSQEDVIQAFVKLRADSVDSWLRVTDWPDKKKGNRNKREIDALAESDSSRLAIEHTSIDSYPEQRKDSCRFMKVVGTLKDEIGKQMNARISLTVNVGAVPSGRGISWPAIHVQLKEWCLQKTPELPDGPSIHNISGVPFPVAIYKQSQRPPGLFPRRSVAKEANFHLRIKKQLDNKIEKLKKYQAERWETVLLVESADPALMSPGFFEGAVQKAYPLGIPSGANHIIFADTSIPEDIQFWDVKNLQIHRVGV